MEPHVQIGEMTAVLPLCPFPPLHWWWLHVHDDAVIERNGSFQKQTLRNRIEIAGPQGPQSIVFPVQQHDSMERSRVQLSAHFQPIQSWRTLQTAYGSSPYFEHIASDLYPLWMNELPSKATDSVPLVNWSIRTIEWVCAACEWPFPTLSSEVPPFQKSLRDLRDKQVLLGRGWTFHRYPQMFESQLGFITGRSVLDALFLIGPYELNDRLHQLVTPSQT